MLLASGINSLDVHMVLGVYAVLGKFRGWFGRKHEDIDHASVMGKDEAADGIIEE